MEVGILFRLVDVMNLILILSHPFSVQMRESYFLEFVNRTLDIVLYSDVYWQISVKLGMTIETTKLCILISVWMTLTFAQNSIF